MNFRRTGPLSAKAALLAVLGLQLTIPVWADDLSEAPVPSETPSGAAEQASALAPDAINVTAIAQAPAVVSPAPKAMLTATVTDQVDAMSKDILKNEIKLQRFSLLYRQNAAKQGRWKGWRYFLFQEANSGLTGAGLITTISERGAHLTGPTAGMTKKYVLAYGGGYPQAIGQILGAAGSGIELAINNYHGLEAHHKGYGSKQARNTAAKIVAEIDQKMAQRQQLLAAQPAVDKEQVELHELEGRVLSDFRDLSMAEFERYHASAKKTLIQQNTFYALDMGKNAFGVVGNFLGVHSILSGHRAYNLSAGIMTTISGAMIAVDPILSRFAAKVAERADHTNMTAHGLQPEYEKADKLESDYKGFCDFCANHKLHDRPELCTVVAREEAYDLNHGYEVDMIQKNAKQLVKDNRTAVQNMGTGLFVGATKIANGVLLTKCGASYQHDAIRTNNLIFSGGTTYLVGTSWAVLDNIRVQVNREKRQQQLSKTNSLPGQLIKQRLSKLDAIDKKI